MSDRIHHGDQVAETELVQAHSEAMLRVIRRRVSNPDSAQDLLHDSLLAALIVLRSRPLRQPQKIANFLVRVAKFQTANYLRSRNGQMIAHACNDLDSLTDNHSPSLVYAQWRQRENLESMIDALKVPRDRRVARRFYLLEESKHSICCDLRISTANFDSINYRIKQRMRRMVFGEHSESNEFSVPQLSS